MDYMIRKDLPIIGASATKAIRVEGELIMPNHIDISDGTFIEDVLNSSSLSLCQ